MRFFIIIICSLFLASCSSVEQTKDSTKKPISNPPHTEKPQPSESVSIEQAVDNAKKGEIAGIPFQIHQNSIDDVKKAWGEPDQNDAAGSGYYATYSDKNMAFGYNKEGRIFDVRSYSSALRELSYEDIEKVMGFPVNSTVYKDDNIYTYQVNPQFQLKWIIPKSTGTVDHISVYSTGDVAVEQYLLPINGASDRLSDSAWANMVKWRQAILDFPKKYPNGVYINGPNRKMVALTFDDGPDLINTPKIIASLKAEHVKATFFFIGQRVVKYPIVVRSAYESGSTIGSHSFYHHELPKESLAEIEKDLDLTSDAIQKVIGVKPALLRPPYGETDGKLVNLAQNDGYKVILWSIDTLDWSQRESGHIQKNVFDNIRNGDIILMHSDEDKEETAKAVPEIIKELKRRGFEIVDVPTLLSTNAYK